MGVSAGDIRLRFRRLLFQAATRFGIKPCMKYLLTLYQSDFNVSLSRHCTDELFLKRERNRERERQHGDEEVTPKEEMRDGVDEEMNGRRRSTNEMEQEEKGMWWKLKRKK